MTTAHDWGFYGRNAELAQLNSILDRNRWFFIKVIGRRRIGKTALIQRALMSQHDRPVFYVQIPDSGPAGVLSAVIDAMETFRIDSSIYSRPRTLAEFAEFVAKIATAGYVVALDEFQYFVRERVSEFTSFLQMQVDRLSSQAGNVRGGLLVLGSVHSEMAELLESRSAPLFNRTTDEINLGHLDISSIVELLKTHGAFSPKGLLFYWSLFEGVPKFYRDCYEQGVLGATRLDVLRKMFFESSSPLRTEADNWFLRELRGRYDVVLK